MSLWDAEIWQAERTLAAQDLTQWSTALPGIKRCTPKSHGYRTNPVVASGFVIAQSSSPSKVFALRPDDGSIVWWRRMGKVGSGGLANDGETLFSGLPHQLCATSILKGKVGWRFVPETLQGERLYAEPVIHGDSVFVSDRAGDLHRLHRPDGGLLWSVQVDPDSENANADLVLIEGKIVCGSNGGFVTACDPEDGHIVWQSKIDGPVIQSPGPVGQHLWAATYLGVWRLNPATGEVLSEWRPDNEEIVESAWCEHGAILVLRNKEAIPTPGSPGMKYQVERLVLLAADGRLKWSLPYPPYSMVAIRYDASLGLLIEATMHGLAFVDVRSGTRKLLLHSFPGKDEYPFDWVHPPCLDSDTLYVLNYHGILSRLSYPSV